ncbi:MAG: ABC transporter ATP-binding protein [Rhodospirillaceae bacterium]|jgi:iron(III) transport system ATP-binding protein|nr:ABC transporter ATP-binding protein [Rhodospirillaceae bacterium]MBT7265334.1 ABC transporter ATP-binding protein [Rhodospirillaceae bacterium]
MGLYLANISHSYGDNEVLDNVDVDVPAGQILCLLGPSGCGKTTLLRIAAGLEKLQQGVVRFGEKVVADYRTQTPAEKRGVGLMFQDFALFPHLNVRDNVAFGLKELSNTDRQQRIDEVLAQVNMQEHGLDFPHTLSGGQQQRVALARALAPKPAVMLLDEPFSGLDQNMRIQIREETLGILKSSGVATLMVTHNPEEALFMADRMMVMGPDGKILQEGSPNEVYADPAHAYVANFFGQANSVTGVSKDGKVATPLGDIDVPDCQDGCNLEVVIRPAAISLQIDGEEPEEHRGRHKRGHHHRSHDTEGIPVDIISARSLGQNTFVRFRVSGSDPNVPDFHSRQRGEFPEKPDGDVRAHVRQRHVFIYHADEKI